MRQKCFKDKRIPAGRCADSRIIRMFAEKMPTFGQNACERIVAGMLFRLKMSHIALILTRFRNGPQIEESQCRGVKGRL